VNCVVGIDFPLDKHLAAQAFRHGKMIGQWILHERPIPGFENDWAGSLISPFDKLFTIKA
jgi:hypothetical protein